MHTFIEFLPASGGFTSFGFSLLFSFERSLTEISGGDERISTIKVRTMSRCICGKPRNDIVKGIEKNFGFNQEN